MITILIRALLLYALMIFAIRMMGKRQLGQFEPYELAMALLIADILATPMSDVSTPLLHGILPVTAMVALHSLITVVSLKSDKARALISGKPSIIISNGIIDFHELNRLSLSLSDLLEGIREFGIMNPWDVECAIMEANGTITAFEKSKKRPPTSEELAIPLKRDEFPVALIMDGKIQKSNLKRTPFSIEYLVDTLLKERVKPFDVLLATFEDDSVSLQTKNGKRINIALRKENNL